MVPLGTPPEELIMSLAHNHMTNLFIRVTEGLLSSNKALIILTWKNLRFTKFSKTNSLKYKVGYF